MKAKDKLISLVCEKKNTRVVNAKETKKESAENFNKDENPRSKLSELQTPDPAKQRYDCHPLSSRNKQGGVG